MEYLREALKRKREANDTVFHEAWMETCLICNKSLSSIKNRHFITHPRDFESQMSD
jgi:hypothetical protein